MIRVVTIILVRAPLRGAREQVQSIEEEIKDVTRENVVHMNPQLHPYHLGRDQAQVKETVASQTMLATDLVMQVIVWNLKGLVAEVVGHGLTAEGEGVGGGRRGREQ